MIYFYKELIKLAQKLIDDKSTQDDIKASIDLDEIDFRLSIACPTREFIDVAKQLDKRINEDYPEIGDMHTVAFNMKNASGIYSERSQSEYEVVLSNLKSDKFGIFTSVLLKHGKISCIKDFIAKVD